ncbi:MAG TPA: hypothetical protein VNM92_02920 [Thermoanaerobaculia bacterium]|nr:hypothetical protein [Thermoanaerobaculia bacterium]
MSDEAGTDHVKRHIELAIDRAREGVGDQVDALDRHLRESLDFKEKAATHAPALIAAGAAVGFLAGFGLNDKLARVLKIAIPLMLVAKVAKARFGDHDSETSGLADDLY